MPSEVVSSYSFTPKRTRFVFIYFQKCNLPLKRTNDSSTDTFLPGSYADKKCSLRISVAATCEGDLDSHYWRYSFHLHCH